MKSIKEIAYYFHMYSNKNTQIFNLHNDTRKLKKHSCFILDKLNEKYYKYNVNRIKYVKSINRILD